MGEAERIIFEYCNRFNIYSSYPTAIMEYYDGVNKNNQKNLRLDKLLPDLLHWKEENTNLLFPRKEVTLSLGQRIIGTSPSRRNAAVSHTGAKIGDKSKADAMTNRTTNISADQEKTGLSGHMHGMLESSMHRR